MDKLQLYFTGTRKDTCYNGKINEVSLYPHNSRNVSTVNIGPSKKAKSEVSFIDTNEYRSVITLAAGELDGHIKVMVSKAGSYKLHISAYALTKNIPCVPKVPEYMLRASTDVTLQANVETVLSVVGTLANDITVEVGDGILYEVEIEYIDIFESSIKVDFIYDGQLMNIDAKLKTTSGGSVGCDMSENQCDGIKGNTSLSATNHVVDMDLLLLHENNNLRHLSIDERGALSDAPHPLSAANPVVDTDTLQIYIDTFTAHSRDEHLHLTSAQNAALDAANDLSASNPVASMSDVPHIKSVSMDIAGLLPTKGKCMLAANILGITEGLFIIKDTFGAITPNYLINYTGGEYYISIMIKAT